MYRIQPVRQVLKDQRWSIAKAAEEIGVGYQHFKSTVYGSVRPNDIVKERLPKLLGVPIEELYDLYLLVLPYQGPSRRGRPLGSKNKKADDQNG